MEIDLKDGFFGVPVDDTLSRLFGFTFGDRRFRWVRLPQGWLWSSVLFGERIAEIIRGIGCPQYSDNVLVGAETPELLLEKALEIFQRFDRFGIKVNFEKVKWLSTEISFLGYEIKDGQISLEKYLQDRMKEVGVVKGIKDLERIIGILSYARRTVKNVEVILHTLREDLRKMKNGEISEEDLDKINQHVSAAFQSALDNLVWLSLPASDAEEYVFVINSDWANGHAGYMLFARKNGEEKLIDIGSKRAKKSSSYLGELDAIQWACQRTKALRGDVPLIIRTDSHSVLDKAKSKNIYDSDVRAYRRWAWLIANESGFKIQFVPGAENEGADLLSRPAGMIHPEDNEPLSMTVSKGKKRDSKCDLASFHFDPGPNSGAESSTEFLISIPEVYKGFCRCGADSDEDDFISDGESGDSVCPPLGFEVWQDEDASKVCKPCCSTLTRSEMEQEVWNEHLKAHWGTYKVFHALRRRGVIIPWRVVRMVCAQCEICAKFRVKLPRKHWGQPPYSVVPGHTIYADVIGPVTPGRGGVEYIQTIIDSATRMIGAMKMRTTQSNVILRGFDQWIHQHGTMKVIVTDNAAYYCSKELAEWCDSKEVVHRFTPPYRHESNGLVERSNRTLVDRLRKLKMTYGGSWADHLDTAIDSINSAVHSVTGFCPHDLWHGTEEMRILAHQRTVEARARRNRARKVYPANFWPGQSVLVFDNVVAASREGKFLPKWKGPYILMEKMSDSLWMARKVGQSVGRGRRPIHVFHEDDLQPFDL